MSATTAGPAATDSRVALVTGGGSGLGEATACAFVAAGYRVVVADRDADGAARVAGALGPAALPVTADITDTAAVDAMVAAALAAFGRIDVLVNNAGLPVGDISAEITDERWASSLEVNLSGVMRCCRAAHPALTRSPDPAVVNISSLAGVTGMPGRASYSAAKAGVIGLTRALAVEWAPAGIRVNAVAPGYIRTAGFEARMMAARANRLSDMESWVPMGRLGTPQDVAAVVVFLASVGAAYITGQTLVVDGGAGVAART
ncbi:SDR family NAD(P)-dependent oxidoreductase [Nakamurella alba]|uniref:SDR family NAD(P)-dependent oxidoreductase n=1 Tax=Nakamurella alba TaxID=2665158 RepID=UPI001E2B87E5|nr:SDR family NAD(P)-dependent oxidoreductase [Nakamurella alba]